MSKARFERRTAISLKTQSKRVECSALSGLTSVRDWVWWKQLDEGTS